MTKLVSAPAAIPDGHGTHSRQPRGADRRDKGVAGIVTYGETISQNDKNLFLNSAFITQQG